ncbi:hypothetical protein FRC07_006886, partial [Ceratobasidium sp. 392]
MSCWTSCLSGQQSLEGFSPTAELWLERRQVELAWPLSAYHWPGRLLGVASSYSFTKSIRAVSSGSDEQSVSGQHWTVSDELEPTRPSTAAAPALAIVASYSLSVSQTFAPLPTPSSILTAPNDDAQDDKGLSRSPNTIQGADLVTSASILTSSPLSIVWRNGAVKAGFEPLGTQGQSSASSIHQCYSGQPCPSFAGVHLAAPSSSLLRGGGTSAISRSSNEKTLEGPSTIISDFTTGSRSDLLIREMWMQQGRLDLASQELSAAIASMPKREKEPAESKALIPAVPVDPVYMRSMSFNPVATSSLVHDAKMQTVKPGVESTYPGAQGSTPSSTLSAGRSRSTQRSSSTVVPQLTGRRLPSCQQRRSTSESTHTSDVADYFRRLDEVAADVTNLFEGVGALRIRIDQDLERLSRRKEKASAGDASVMDSPDIERRKTEIRAMTNVSPLAHKTLKRMNSGLVEDVPPRPELSRTNTRTRTGESHPGHRSDPIDLENSRSISFHPVLTSSPVRSHIPEYGRLADYSDGRELSSRARENPDLTRSVPTILPGTTLIQEPLPPITRHYLSFGSDAA